VKAAVALLVAGVIGLAACGGGAAAPTTAPTTTPPTTTAPTITGGATPTESGDQIGTLCLAAYEALVALLADRPDAASAAAAVSALKEQYVQQLVALGHQREALGTADRATVDARITAALNALPPATYDAYQQAFTDYGSDLEVANLIASFNILGQYANFDLLREQAPEEAARLGVG
jgi:hypothetical protein